MENKVIDFEFKKYLKESGDEFMDLVEVIERHFNYSKSAENIFKRITFTAKYLANLFYFALPTVDNKEFKPIILNIFRELTKLLEDKNNEKN